MRKPAELRGSPLLDGGLLELRLKVCLIGSLLKLRLLNGKLIGRSHVAGAGCLLSCRRHFGSLLVERVRLHLLLRCQRARSLHLPDVELTSLKGSFKCTLPLLS